MNNSRIVLITGCSRGLGRAMVDGFIAEGDTTVVGCARSKKAIEELRAQNPAPHSFHTLDVRDPSAVEKFARIVIAEIGAPDLLINNAGILRDRMIFSMSESDWDGVIGVHLKGTYAPTHHAANYWRERAKSGEDNDARVINTSSPSGIYGNIGQANYGAAKAGIAAFTVITAMELAKYGVTCNALAPAAYTRMTADLPGFSQMDEEAQEKLGPRWIANVATWLASPEAAGVTGRVFDVAGQRVGIAEGWVLGPHGQQGEDAESVGSVVNEIIGKARLNSNMFGKPEGGVGRPNHA